jgi:cytoskeletal protein CcmA (bactofilin family)
MGLWKKSKVEDEEPVLIAAPLAALAPEPRAERARAAALEPAAEALPKPSAPRVLASAPERRPAPERGPSRGAHIGRSIHIKGDVVGDEDLLIEGRIEGRVELKDHQLTIGAAGEITGEVRAKQVIVLGQVTGDVCATERVEVADGGRLHGDIESPRLMLQEGAHINGKIDMRPPQSPVASVSRKTEKESERAKGGLTPLPSSASAHAQAASRSS